MSKENPKNREEAFAHQLKDDVEMLFKYASMPDSIAFKNGLKRIEMHIHSYKHPMKPENFQLK